MRPALGSAPRNRTKAADLPRSTEGATKRGRTPYRPAAYTITAAGGLVDDAGRCAFYEGVMSERCVKCGDTFEEHYGKAKKR